ncbi:hypothetical protein ALC62_07877 [Cyphomyrmex costatus]|uniref:Regulatory protein zeste n=1 Tax=Cyphomyrmex costatus TaxID=456900 RepID=A0A195CKM4_9HYME|nr:hypothetical protein ALC62_07877 [Cyphomyrmex costatus]
MRPCRLSEEEKEEEEDNSRRRNQFSKDERFVLLSIMGQYAPLLDDKSASVFDRREIWRAIERDFHRAGFTGKTSAQLKKYWQNYKYHGRRTQALSHVNQLVRNKLVQGVKKHSNATLKHAVEEVPHPEVSENRDNLEIAKIAKERTLPCNFPHNDDALLRNDPGCRQCEIYEDNGTFFRKLSATPIHPTNLDSLGKNRSSSDSLQSKGFSSKVYEEPRPSDVTDREPEKPIGTDVIVSNTDISDNSVTVSVICPEKTPELFRRNQSKRKREDDASLDKFSHQSDISAVSAGSSSKKRGSDDQSIFPTAAGAAKGCCFLLQPRQTDNHGEVISNQKNKIEIRRKLEPAKEGSTVLPSKFVSQSKVSRSVSERKIPVTIKQDSAKENSVSPGIRDTVRNSTGCHKESREESKIDESPASGSQRNDSNGTASDAARSCIPNVRLRDRDEGDSVQWELQDELNYRLTLHRLETEEKRLKVKIAEMAIQEIRFRIRALNEDIRRADELHELQLALATAQAVNQIEHANTIAQKRIHRDTVIRSQWFHYFFFFFFITKGNSWKNFIRRVGVGKNKKDNCMCLKLFLLIAIISHVTMSSFRKTHGTIQNNNALRFLW